MLKLTNESEKRITLPSEHALQHLTAIERSTMSDNHAISDNSFGQDARIHQGDVNIYNSSPDTRADILRRLYILPYEDLKDRNPPRFLGTCDWFTSHGLFSDWEQSESSRLLWVSADPGCGKSVLVKYLVDSVLQNTESRTVCYFFFKDDSLDQKNIVYALRCILRQLFIKKPRLFSDDILHHFTAGGETFINSFSELWKTLLEASKDQHAGEIICILDAIDECGDLGRSQLAHELCKVYGGSNDFQLKFLLTSRPYGKIRRHFRPLEIPELPVIHLSGENEQEVGKISQEIDIFIQARVDDIKVRLQLLKEERDFLLEKLMHIPNRTYLWAYLTLEMIESDISINKAKIAEITSGIPEKVDQAYEKILSKSHDVEQAKKILHIIVAAVRPLALKEMNLALLLQQSHRSNNDFNLEPEDRFRQELRDICGLFITVINSKLYLLHQTAKEFLLQDTANSAARIHRSLTWKNSLNLLDSHHILSNICIWYLLNLEFEMNSRNGPGTSCLNTEDMIFLDYSSKHWATHFRELLIKTQKEKKESILKLCDTKSRRFQVWFEAYWASTNSKLPRGFTSLMAAAYFGLQTATQHLLEIKSDINRQDDTYQRTALCWAVRNGFKAVAELLIRGARYKHAFIKIPWRKKAKVDQVDKYGRTPLSYAVWNDSTAMVELLIKAGAQVRLKDELGGTPISYAICSQNEGVIDILVQKGNQADVEDDINYLLFSAAKKGHEEVIELLLKTGQVSPDARDQTSQTPLLYAAKESHKEIVKMLLMAGANPNSKDNHGQTPLMYSAHNGDEAAVRILLEGGADPNDRDKNGRTPLSRAAEKGHVAIVKVLLRRGAENYPMPLLYAADSGHEAAIRILLEQGADPNYTGHRQRTALSYAADSGHEAVTELLLEQGADTNYNDIDGRTALSYAATKGHEGIVKALLERGADPNYRDKDNRTPLSRAAEKGHAAIVKVLLERGVKDYSTSLLYAADNGHEAVVKVLLEDGADPNCKDLRRRTALSFAVGKGYDTIVDALLEGGAEPAHKEINYVHRASRSNTAPWPLRGRKLFPFLSKGEKAKTF